MKKIILSLAMGLLSFWLFAQQSARLDSARAQMNRKLYLTAFETLNRDGEDLQGAVPMVVGLLVDYAETVTKDYAKWTLSDKSGNTTVRQQRVDMELESLLMEAIGYYPSDCAIYSSLCKFYSYVFNTEHLYTPIETLEAIRNFLEKKVPAGCADEYYYYATGYAANYLGKPAAGLTDLQKALAKNPGNVAATLELANSYFLTKDYPNATRYARKALELADHKLFKSRAALLMGEIYNVQNDNRNALANFLLADSFYRKEFFIQKALLDFYVKTDNPKAPDAIKAFVGAQGRTNLHNYIDVIEIYAKHKRLPDLSMYCQQAIVTNDARPDIQACYNFLLGLIHKSENMDTARMYLRRAREQGIKAENYPPTRNHPVTGKLVEEAFELIR